MSSTRLIGLTGGIACGKSEVASILAGLGVPVLDTDAVAHKLLDPGHWVYERVVQAFGSEFTRPEGGIDRRRLGSLVFGDEAARERLNAIVHPEVFAEVDRWVADKARGHDVAVVMLPLLYETGSESRFDSVLAVVSDDAAVVERLKVRGLSESEASSRIAAQLPVEEKAKRADAVIRNDGDLQDLKEETLRIWNEEILGKEA